MDDEAPVTNRWRRAVVGAGRALTAVVIATLVLGLGSAVAVTALAAPGDRTFAAVSGPVQSLMSVTVPFLGVILVRDQVRRGGSLVWTVAVAEVLAAAFAVVGIGAAVVVTAVAPSTAGSGRWEHAVLIGLGSILVQALASMVGIGFGLLIRSTVGACLATVVFPLGLWLLLGAVPVLAPARAWLTPFASAEVLLAGEMGPLDWLHWLVMVAVWGVGLNLVGAARQASRR